MDDTDRALCEALGHTFRDEHLLEVALTHRTAAFEAPSARKRKGVPHNERMEFLGDAVLALVVSDALWKRYPDATEGELSQMRAALVNEARLAEIAVRLRIGESLRLGRGEEATGGRTRASLLANGLEALFAAVYLDAGVDRAREVILGLFEALFDQIDRGEIVTLDPKTRLQEMLQARYNLTPRYDVIGHEGLDNQRVWFTEVVAGEVLRARGRGGSKKSAALDAARNALRELDAPSPATEAGDD